MKSPDLSTSAAKPKTIKKKPVYGYTKILLVPYNQFSWSGWLNKEQHEDGRYLWKLVKRLRK